MAKENGIGIALRQNYNRTAPKLAAQIGRYAHAKQCKRMKKALRTLRTRVGRVQQEVARQVAQLPEQAKANVIDLLSRTAASSPSARKTRTSCMRCMLPKSSASRKAGPAHRTSSA